MKQTISSKGALRFIPTRANNIISIILVVLVLLVFESTAQETIPATGGTASGSGGSATYTLGQVFTTTSSDTSASVAAGVQQPYEISEITSLPEAKSIMLTATVFPNPATEFVVVDMKEMALKSVSYKLFDSSGKEIQGGNIISAQTTINTLELAAGTYFLKVLQGNKEVKTFKIIKNK